MNNPETNSDDDNAAAAVTVTLEGKGDGNNKRQLRLSNNNKHNKSNGTDDNVENNEEEKTVDDFDIDGIAIHQNPNIEYAAEAFIASQLAKLSVEDREKIYYDIHGITDQVEETTEFIQQKLTEFQNEIDMILQQQQHNNTPPQPPQKEFKPETPLGLSRILSTEAYEIALKIDPNYVHDTDLILMFLRTERFASKPAAKRLIHWFQVKLDLFGPALLTKTITQLDLDEDDEGALYDGYKQILPLRDRAGRLVFCDVIARSKCDNLRSWYSKLRRKFYSGMVCSEDVETQQKGTVVVCYCVDAKDDTNYEFKLIQSTISVMEALPLRTEAIHFCHNSHWIWTPKIALFQLGASIFTSLRVRVHYGDHAECLFKLQTFGIPVGVMPLTSEGLPSIDQNTDMWKKRREYEQRYLLSSSYPSAMNGKTIEPILADEVTTTTTTAVTTTATATAHESEDESHTTADDTLVHDDNDTTTHVPGNVSSSPASSSILFPGQFDILLGRGRGYHCHVGNIKFRNRIEECKDEYENCNSRDAKKQMTLRIVDEVQSSGGRFLRQDVTGWIIVDGEEARLKVSHTFRNLKAKSSGKKKTTTTTTITTTMSTTTTTSTKRMNPE